MTHCMEKTVPGKDAVHRNFDVLIDSDALVGWFWAADSHHAEATQIFHTLEATDQQLVLTSLVVGETATVLSHRSGQALARTFLDHIERSKVPVIHITEELNAAAIALFKAQTVKGTSLTDCANAVVARQFGIQELFSFDKVYARAFGLNTVT